MHEPEPVTILPAEYVGEAAHDHNGVLRIGEDEHQVEIRLTKGSTPGWWNTGTVSVYVRRMSSDLSVAEIAMARHDGVAKEAFDAQNEEAARDPLGPKEYWRTNKVGRRKHGPDHQLMTDEVFEEYWNDGDY